MGPYQKYFCFLFAFFTVFSAKAVDNNCNLDLINFKASVEVKDTQTLGYVKRLLITLQVIIDRHNLESLLPIYAYDSRLLCNGQDSFWKDENKIVIEDYHQGPYSLVVEKSPGVFRAFYFAKLDRAVQAAKECELLCGDNSQWPSDRWFLGSTYPILVLNKYKKERSFLYEYP